MSEVMRSILNKVNHLRGSVVRWQDKKLLANHRCFQSMLYFGRKNKLNNNREVQLDLGNSNQSALNIRLWLIIHRDSPSRQIKCLTFSVLSITEPEGR